MLRGRRLYSSLIHHILRKRIYSGDFDFDGVTYKGTYTPLVSRETWERVQAILDGRTSSSSRQRKRQFTLTGLVHCGHCGCLMVGELKKGRYVYYHCTGSKGRCGDPYVREEQLLREVARGLDQLVIAPETLAWLRTAVAESDLTERGARKQLKAEYDRLQARIETMYLDRLDGRITAQFFDERSKTWREEQKRIEAQMQTTALRSAMEALEIMQSVSDACGSIPGPAGAAAAGDRVGADAEGDLEGREVRVGAERAVPDFGALELCKQKERKGKTRFRAGPGG